MEVLDKVLKLWNTPGVSQVVSAIVGGGCASMFHLFKTRVEQRVVFQNELGRKKADALFQVRELILQLDVFEALEESIYQALENNENSKNLIWYPQFMSDFDTLLDYWREILEVRGKYEPFLSYKTAAQLYTFDMYLRDLIFYIKEGKLYNACQYYGALILPDVQRWQRSFDALIVKEINNPSYKLFSKNSWLWNFTRDQTEKKFRKNLKMKSVIQGAGELVEYQESLKEEDTANV